MAEAGQLEQRRHVLGPVFGSSPTRSVGVVVRVTEPPAEEDTFGSLRAVFTTITASGVSNLNVWCLASALPTASRCLDMSSLIRVLAISESMLRGLGP